LLLPTKIILLIEDSLGDIRLTQEALKEIKHPITLHIATDGEQAMAYLYKEEPFTNANPPDLILLDLNLPKKHGLEILKEIKNDPNLKKIPVLILSISQDEEDILQCYNLHANCYINKPLDIDTFMEVISSTIHFWFDIVTSPTKKEIEGD
jgi:chemotaxis family two-component system response regulator Rcp1